MAPYFSLSDYQGDTVRLSDFKGRPLLLVFWFPTCAVCLEELPEYQNLHREFSSSGLRVVAVDVNHDSERARAVIEEEALTFTLLEGNEEIAGDYGVRQTPTIFLINSEGVIINRYNGTGSGMKKDIRNLVESR